MADRPDLEKLKADYRALSNSELEDIMQKREKAVKRSERLFNWITYPTLAIGIFSPRIWDAIPAGLRLIGCNDVADSIPQMDGFSYAGVLGVATLTTLLAYIRYDSGQRLTDSEEYYAARNILKARDEAGDGARELDFNRLTLQKFN